VELHQKPELHRRVELHQNWELDLVFQNRKHLVEYLVVELFVVVDTFQYWQYLVHLMHYNRMVHLELVVEVLDIFHNQFVHNLVALLVEYQ
jgi:hypothetical protein